MSTERVESTEAVIAAERPLLEVIALTPEDARAAEAGGADRLEIVREIGVGGLTPTLAQFEAIRAAVALPLRVMLRSNGDFQVSQTELATLVTASVALRRAGADQFVFGFLDDTGALDRSALETLCEATSPCSWTLHHAFDHATHQRSAWQLAGSLPKIDSVLSGGMGGDLNRGLDVLCERAPWQTDTLQWLAGGGLVLDFVPALRTAGIRQFHIGRAARPGQSWDHPINSRLVLRWRDALDG